MKTINNIENEPFEERRKVKNYYIHNDLLYKKTKIHRKTLITLYVPISMRLTVLQKCHDELGQFGIAKTLNRITSKFFWPKIKWSVTEYVNTCIKCQLRKPKNHRMYGRPQLMPIPSGIFEILGIDLYGSLPETTNKNKFILTVVDHLSKWVILEPLSKTDSDTIFKTLENRVFLKHGYPHKIISDNGTSFVSVETENFLEEGDINNHKDHNLSPSFKWTSRTIPQSIRTKFNSTNEQM